MKYLLFLGCSLGFAIPAMAAGAGDATELSDRLPGDRIVVVATGADQPVDKTGQSVSVIGADEIAQVQGPDLARALERLPGVTLSRNGGLGGFTGLRLRGADAEQLLVLVDGVRTADVASPAGGYDLGNLLSGGIGKVELLRGSNSVVWGSQAIGGVLAVTSREFNGVELSAEGGSHGSADLEAAAGISGDRGGLTLSGGYVRTDGISSAASGTEPDGFRQWRIGGRGRIALATGLTATLVARHTDGRLDIDGFPPPIYAFADTPEYQTTRESSGRAGLQYRSSGLELDAGYALSDIRRAYFDPTFGTAPNYQTFGRSQRIDVTGRAGLASGFSLIFGADSEWTRFSSTFDARRTANLSSGHALLQYERNGLNLAAGLRIDSHSRFGSQWTFGANGNFDIAQGWRIRASYGEGFKAPTLFQLWSDFGNSALRPERSRSYDLGIEKGHRNAPFHAALTLFRRDSRDLIDFVSCFGVSTGICAGRPFGTYDNVNRARAEGIELEAGGRPTDRLTLRAAYSMVKATNRVTGTDLARRPRHAVSLSADWRTPLRDLSLGADLRAVSHSFDDAGNFTRLDGHGLLTLRASLPVTGQVELYGRIENVTGEHYQTAAGYGTAGRSAYAGVRARF